jgi:hypothetical protein
VYRCPSDLSTEEGPVKLERISACTYPVRDRDLDYTFGLLAGVGFVRVDLWGGPPNYHNDPAVCDPDALRSAAACGWLTWEHMPAVSSSSAAPRPS